MSSGDLKHCLYIVYPWKQYLAAVYSNIVNPMHIINLEKNSENVRQIDISNTYPQSEYSRKTYVGVRLAYPSLFKKTKNLYLYLTANSSRLYEQKCHWI